MGGADQHLLLRAMVDELVRCGVRTALTSPGSRSSPLVFALIRDGRLACHSLIDERSSGFFALGSAKATGMPAVVTCTSGTAAANLLPAVVEAWEAGVPMIVLTADRPPELREVGAGQAIDQVKLYGQAVKWFFELGTHEATPGRLRWARTLACRLVWAALDERPGPVHLNVALREPLVPPPDLPADASARSGGRPRLLRSGAGADGSVPALAAHLAGARRPLLVVGRSEPRPGRAGAGQAVAAWAARYGVPVLSDPLGGARRGAGAVAHYDALLRDEAFAAQVVPDLVVRVGDLPTSKPLRGWLAALPEETVQVAFDPAGAWHDPDGVLALVLAADPASALEAARAGEVEEGWAATWEEADAAAARALGETLGDGLSEPGVAAHLLATLPADAALVVASSMPVRDAETFGPVRDDPPRVLSNRGANGIDGTISTALGVACAHPGPTVLLTGDVTVVHDLGGLAACARAGPALTIVLLDNAGGGIFDFLPIAAAGAGYEEHVATPPQVDFAHAAAMAGLAYRTVGSLGEIAVAEAPTLLHVRSERTANVELHRRCWAAVHAAVGRVCERWAGKP